MIYKKIEAVKALKQEINEGKFNSELISIKIETVLNEFWMRDKKLSNDDLYEVDMKDLCSYHEYLISEVTDIMLNEYSEKNSRILNENSNFKKCINEFEDSKSAFRKYVFNKENDFVFIGDIHSDDFSLKEAIEKSKLYDNYDDGLKLVFTGDYVDRGNSHLKTMERLLTLKYLFPNNVFLLRGNHDGGNIQEDGSIKLPYRIPVADTDEWYFPMYLRSLSKKNDTFDEGLLHKYLNFFDQLTYIAIIKVEDSIIMAVHGGIPRPIDEEFKHMVNLSDLTNEEIKDHIGATTLENLFWSDPHNLEEDIKWDNRRFRFSKDQFKAFKDKFGVDFLIRGHQVANKGYEYHFDETLLTLFSSGSIHDKCFNDDSAYDEVEPKILLITRNGDRVFK